ncbi:uncharacterized protein MAM_00220 [Metarhizium album ARSEF 1941]|uniref:Uncharacterized protein n=1 Tax=Metarhizium album (strain ARSEF 1941) TaxID=1081103 RepID=A0A0B2X4E4_METAS|nr:uncharacterized protein MAM_00220 [Metarhizium album ARSEF 1941]KHO01219.1 hypothetical protein MAM_00220 [Metarhizium album ARSEF 1941]
MYIPPRELQLQAQAAGTEAHGRSGGSQDVPRRAAELDGAAFQRRQFSGDSADATNVQIGIALGIILGVFLIATCAFLYMYRSSVRFTYRKRRRRRAKSSRSSSKSTESTPPPPPPPPAASEEEPPK